MRFACDTGGTFTDLVIEDDDNNVHMFKAYTTPDDPVRGVLDAFKLAATSFGLELDELLARGESFIHGTTHPINAVITGKTAKTAFLTTAGHPDILTIREGGRADAFDYTIPYPEPYISRALTYEVPERILASGDVRLPLDEQAILNIIRNDLVKENIEAVAVCLLWSTINAAHELRIGELLDQHLPGIPYTLSSQLNPTIREFRRASSACIDASLKPLMGRYLGNLEQRLKEAGYGGRILVLTSLGGMVDADELANAPILALNSGPSMAPLAGRYYGEEDGEARTIIVADTGGTTYDVSLVRDGNIPMTPNMWVGQPYLGHMTGFASVDVKSVGAGGGSIAWVDGGGVLHVGPQSAGAVPGPACYATGGNVPTVTDAALLLGYLDANFFLGGKKKLDAAASERTMQEIADKLQLSLHETAALVIELATENMVQAIEDITVNQGIDPSDAVLIGGGGAAGLNSVFIAKRLGCKKLVIPEVGAALSAAGALMSDLMSDYRRTYFTVSNRFDEAGVNQMLAGLTKQCQTFIEKCGTDALSHTIQHSVDARYKNQVWEIEIPLSFDQFSGAGDLHKIIDDFHDAHEQIFMIRDPDSPVEFVNWRAVVRCKLHSHSFGRLIDTTDTSFDSHSRRAYFSGHGFVEVSVYDFKALPAGKNFAGPAVIESPFTSIVVDPTSGFSRSKAGSLIVCPQK